MEKQYFTVREALERVIEELEGGYSDYYCDLHNTVFNYDYYIIGTTEAEQALEQYGVFKAIKEVSDWERYANGEVTTDITNPEKLASMLWYVIGEQALERIDYSSLLQTEDGGDYWDSPATDEVNAYLVKEITPFLEGLANE